MSSTRRCLCWSFLVILCSIKGIISSPITSTTIATSGLSTGALVGIVVGIGGTTVLVFIVLVVLVLLVVILKHKRNTKKGNDDTGLNDTPPDTALQEPPLSPGLEDNIAYGSATTDSDVNTSTNVAYGQNETAITASSAYDTVRFSN